MAYLTIRIKGADGHSQALLDKDRNVVGRSSTNEVAVKHTSISREHFVILRVDGAWFVEDVGSANGTWVNADKLVGRLALHERDIIKAGQARMTFHAGEVGAVEAAVELNLTSDDSGGAAAAVRRGDDDPPEAMACAACAGWFSFAHRAAGDTLACPRCGQRNTIPMIVA